MSEKKSDKIDKGEPNNVGKDKIESYDQVTLAFFDLLATIAAEEVLRIEDE